MAKVFPVDLRLIAHPRVAARAAGRRRLLACRAVARAGRHRPLPARHGPDDRLHRAGAGEAGEREGARRAARYVQSHLAPDADAYTLALANELFARVGYPAVSERLWSLHRREGAAAFFPEAPGGTLTYGAGKSGDVETTARAALSLLASGRASDRVSLAVGYLVGAKDTFGNWYSTQATIRSLQALLRYEASRTQERSGTVTVSLDGKDVASLEVVGAHQLAQSVELPPDALFGEHEVTVRYRGSGELTYQLVVGTSSRRGGPAAAGALLHGRHRAVEGVGGGGKLRRRWW